MSVKSTKQKANSPRDFPKLMVTTEGKVVLFSAEGRGTVVFNEESNGFETSGIGYHTNSWSMRKFTDYLAEVTLFNG